VGGENLLHYGLEGNPNGDPGEFYYNELRMYNPKILQKIGEINPKI